MSARSWHMYNSFPLRLSCTRLASQPPARAVTLSLASSSRSESTLVSSLPDQAQQSRLRCTSDSPPPSIHEPCSRSLCRERRFCRPVSPFVPRSTSRFVLAKTQPIAKFQFSAKQQTVINVNENVDVHLIVSETTRICQEWVIVQTFQDTDKHVGVTVPVLCDTHTTLCSVSTLRHRATLHHTIRQVLVALQTSLGQYLRAAMLCVR